MSQQTRLALNAAAWFFVGNSDDEGTINNVPISPPFRIGRDPSLELCLPCSSVSGLHAEIVELGGVMWLVDLGSTNGTFVNGIRIQSKSRLRENDTVQFGTSVFHITREMDTESVSEPVPVTSSPKPASANERFERLLTGGVVPFIQPVKKIDGPADEIVGYEVLGRSRLFGLHTPAQMFAAASKLELEAELSRMLRKQGIAIADECLPENHLLFVNTHPAELQCRGLEESLFEIREQHPNRPVMIEVHESVLNDGENFGKLRTTLKSLNIQLALHDFGSSKIRLAEMCNFSPDIVKFDVNLIQGIHQASSKRQQFVAALVKMMKDMGIQPMAECVEQAAEHETIQQLGFEFGQGFYYGRPRSIDDSIQNDSELKRPQVGSFLDDTYHPARQNEVGKPKDDQWLLKQPGHQYSIQVLSAISLDRAQEHVAAQEHSEQFAIFSKQGKTRLLYIVVCGVFADRTAAKMAAAKLASSAVSPWIRLLSSIHAEIESVE